MKNSLVFRVTRRQPELLAPAIPTPHMFRLLSDIDQHEDNHHQMALIQIYKHSPWMISKDPVDVIRGAIRKALVLYSPFAGRIRESIDEQQKCRLVVECNDEGLMFIEADADATVDQLADDHHHGGGVIFPPIPCFDQLLFDVPGSSGLVDSPLMLIQVTRMKCKGFIFALRFNHIMGNTIGIVRFMGTVGEIARGKKPVVEPVWQRELFIVGASPYIKVTRNDDLKGDLADTRVPSILPPPPEDQITCKFFFFSTAHVSTLRRKFVSPQLSSCSTYEVLSACLWRCRTIALQLNPADEVRLLCIVDVGDKLNPPLHEEYYGNAFATSTAATRAEKLCQSPLSYALELVTKVKQDVPDDYAKLVLSHISCTREKDPLHFSAVHAYFVPDLRHAGFRDVDFGWGKAVYGGPPVGEVHRRASYVMSLKGSVGGENVIAVPVNLPVQAMDRFEKELDNMLKTPHMIASAL